MATIKKPDKADSVTAQTEGGTHPRGTGAKNYERDAQSPPRPGPGSGGGRAGAGKHDTGARAGADDLDRDPGIDTPDSDRDELG